MRSLAAVLQIASLIVSVSSFSNVQPRVPRPSTTALGLTLYGHPGTRSPLINWALIELGVDFEMGDLSKNPHPFGQMPCLEDDDDTVVFESGAILQYLVRFYFPSDDKKLVGSIMSWITWANASLDPICFKETPQGKVYDTGLREPNARIDRVDALLEKQDYLTPDFSLADVAVASYFLFALVFFPGIDLSRWPNVVAYLQRCVDRPAYGQAFGASVQTRLSADLSKQSNMKLQGDKKLFGMF